MASITAGVLNILLQKVTDTLIKEYGYLEGVPGDITSLTAQLHAMHAFLVEEDHPDMHAFLVEEDHPDMQVIKWIRMAREAFYEMEDVHDLFMLRVAEKSGNLHFRSFMTRLKTLIAKPFEGFMVLVNELGDRNARYKTRHIISNPTIQAWDDTLRRKRMEEIWTAVLPWTIAPKLGHVKENAPVLMLDSGAHINTTMPKWILQPRGSIGRKRRFCFMALSDISTNKETSGSISGTPRPADNSFILKSGAYHSATTDYEVNGVSSENIFKLSRACNGGSDSEGTNCRLSQQSMLTGGSYVAGLKLFMTFFAASNANTNMKQMPTTAGSVHCRRRATNSVWAAAVSLLQQYCLNSPGDKPEDSRCSICTLADLSSAETTCIPMVHELTGNELRHHSDPYSCSVGRRIIKEVPTNTPAIWVIATGAPHHVTRNRALLSGFIAEHDDVFVHAVDEVPMQVFARGAVVTDAVVLPDVWFAPGVISNMVSVSQLVSLNYSVGFDHDACYIISAADGKIVGKAQVREGGQYVLEFLKVPLAM